MHILVMELTAIGFSMDIYAAVTCQGAMLASIKKRKVLAVGGIFCIGQMLSFLVGYLSARALLKSSQLTHVNEFVLWIAGILFVAAGGRMLWRGIRDVDITEHLIAGVSIKEEIETSLKYSLNGLLGGIACGFCGMTFWQMLVSIVILTILMVILGYYSGFRLGTAPRKKAYLAGGCLLVIAGAVVIMQCFFE